MARIYKPKQFAPIIYPDWAELFDALTVEQRADTLNAIARYPHYTPDNKIWPFIKSQLDKQLEQFQQLSTIRANSRRGIKSEQMTTNDDTGRHMSTNVNTSEQMTTNVPLPKPKPESKPEPKKEIKKKNVFVPPTLDEVKEYCKMRGIVESIAVKIFDYYTALDWRDSQGRKIERWKAKIISVWDKPENHIEQPKPYNPDDPEHFKL